MAEAANAPEEYRFTLSRRRRLPIYAALGFFLGLPAALLIGAALAADEALLAAGLIVALIMLPFAVYLGYSLRRPLLLLTKDGVYLRGIGGGGETSVPWQAIEELALDRGAEGLVLKEPLVNRFMQRQRNWAGTRVNGVSMTPEKNLPLIARFRFIPLTGFAEWFERGNLLTAFQTHAPHLVSDFAARRRDAARAARVAPWVWMWIAALMLLFLGFAFWFANADITLSPAWQGLGAWALKIAFLMLAIALSSAVWSNLRSSRRLAAERQWAAAIFWLVSGLVQCAMVLLALVLVFS